MKVGKLAFQPAIGAKIVAAAGDVAASSKHQLIVRKEPIPVHDLLGVGDHLPARDHALGQIIGQGSRTNDGRADWNDALVERRAGANP